MNRAKLAALRFACNVAFRASEVLRVAMLSTEDRLGVRPAPIR